MNVVIFACGGFLVGFGVFFLISNLLKRSDTGALLAILLIFLGFGLKIIVKSNIASEVEQNYTDETAIYEEAVTDGYTVYINGMETDPENIDFDTFLRTDDITVTYNDDAKKILITK